MQSCKDNQACIIYVASLRACGSEAALATGLQKSLSIPHSKFNLAVDMLTLFLMLWCRLCVPSFLVAWAAVTCSLWQPAWKESD